VAFSYGAMAGRCIKNRRTQVGKRGKEKKDAKRQQDKAGFAKTIRFERVRLRVYKNPLRKKRKPWTGEKRGGGW